MACLLDPQQIGGIFPQYPKEYLAYSKKIQELPNFYVYTITKPGEISLKNAIVQGALFWMLLCDRDFLY